MTSGRTLANAIVGAIVGVVLSFIPLSPVIGGGTAGFLEGSNARQGAVAGALAGAIAFLPVAGFAMLGLGVLGFGMGVVAAPIEGFAIAALAIVGFGLILFLYTVGLSLLGGYLGALLAREYPDQRRQAQETIGLSSDRSERSRSLGATGSRGTRPDVRVDSDRGRRDHERDRERGRFGTRESASEAGTETSPEADSDLDSDSSASSDGDRDTESERF
ncbi:DUF5518 domain-containing protein [Haloterrigena salifodinae]|uniref:DUF5518 domain-containing protein n=1 Tax=Haloterrigena salifodinae TaxID=2675099 RepID=UPI000F897364|nr:DUF5518 domain-containing protein [Haloterrigena salifodinae]